MDRRERWEDLNQALIVAMQGWQSGLWTALPGIVQSFDSVAMTVTVKAAIQIRIRDTEGTYSWETIKPIQDVPVCFPNGGGYTLTFPVKNGDEALLVFASRCIDNWWQTGAVGPQGELRMHDLSDGFAIIGPRSQARLVPNISTTGVRLQKDDGTLYIDMTLDSIILHAPTKVTISSPTVEFTGNVTVDGTLTGQGTNVHTHIHPDPQGGNTGAPN